MIGVSTTTERVRNEKDSISADFIRFTAQKFLLARHEDHPGVPRHKVHDAASAFAEQSGYFSILPSIIGGLIVVRAGIFITVALAILIVAKAMLWVLICTAPIFIACTLQSLRRLRAF